MKAIYKFVAGNSRITPVGIVLAALVVAVARHALGWWSAPLYLAILLGTLAAATAEPVQ